MAPMSTPPGKRTSSTSARLWSAGTKLLSQELRIELGKRKITGPSWAVLCAFVFYLTAGVALAVLCHSRIGAWVLP